MAIQWSEMGEWCRRCLALSPVCKQPPKVRALDCVQGVQETSRLLRVSEGDMVVDGVSLRQVQGLHEVDATGGVDKWQRVDDANTLGWPSLVRLSRCSLTTSSRQGASLSSSGELLLVTSLVRSVVLATPRLVGRYQRQLHTNSEFSSRKV